MPSESHMSIVNRELGGVCGGVRVNAAEILSGQNYAAT